MVDLRNPSHWTNVQLRDRGLTDNLGKRDQAKASRGYRAAWRNIMSNAIKVAAIASAMIAMPMALSGAWIMGEERHTPPTVVKVFVDPALAEPASGDGTVPQFDSGDPRFIIDPDGTNDSGRNKTCGDGDGCDGPDDPVQAVIPT
jgi:hypothetical protein